MKKLTQPKMMKRKFIAVILMSTISVFSTSCQNEKEGPAERAGKQIDSAVELGKKLF
jgi:hypothetical protein